MSLRAAGGQLCVIPPFPQVLSFLFFGALSLLIYFASSPF